MLSFCIQGAYHALLNHYEQNYDTAVEVVEGMVKSIFQLGS
jgi:hypothetical protein